MNTILSSSRAETVVNRSKFLAHLVPIEAFDTLRTALRHEHPKANHIAWACRRLNEHGRVDEDFSDDGEPKGCAGMPILAHLRGGDMVGCGVLVVRYFGGIKLGTGGMARAYGQAAKKVLEAADIVPYETIRTLTFFAPFADVGRWEYETGGLRGTEIERTFDDKGAHWRVTGPENSINRLAALLEKARMGFSIE